MIRTAFVLVLASACVVACSQSSPSQSPASGQAAPAATPASNDQAPPTASKPASPETPAAAASTEGAAPRSAQPPVQSAPAAAPEPAPPAFRDVTIPAGTTLSVRLLSTLASNSSKIEDPVKGSLSKPVTVAGATALPAGTPITGSVLEANESGRVKGRASVVFRFDRLVANGETMRIQTDSIKREAASDKKSDVKKGGIGAGVGAIVGGVVGGGKGAAIGAVAGGTGTVLATKGNEIEIPSGTIVSVLLQDPLTVTVPNR